MYVPVSGAESILRGAPESLARRSKSAAAPGELAPITFERQEVSYLLKGIGDMRRRFEGVLPLLAAVHSENCLAGHVRRGDQYVLVGPPVAIDFDIEASDSLIEALAATVATPERRQLNGLTRAFADALSTGGHVRLSHALVEPCLEVARVLIAEWERKQASGSDVEMEQAEGLLGELEELAGAVIAARDRIEHGLVTADADRVVVLPEEAASAVSRLVRGLGRGEAREEASTRAERVAAHRFVLQRDGLTIDVLRIPSDGSSPEAWTVLALEDSRGARLLPLIVDIDDNPVAMREPQLREALKRATQILLTVPAEASNG